MNLRVESDGQGGVNITAHHEGSLKARKVTETTETTQSAETVEEEKTPEPSFFDRMQTRIAGFLLVCVVVVFGFGWVKNKLKNFLN